MTHSIKTIAVHLPGAAFSSRLLDAAIPLAETHGAMLIGVHVIPAVVVYADATVSMSTEFIVAQQEAFQEDARAIEAAFHDRVEAAGIAHEWSILDTGDDPTMRAASTLCNTADLVVATQYDDSIPAAAGYSPDELVLGTGRPVLIVPAKGEFAPVGARVIVAWNGSRECARATFDSLPLLRENVELKLVTVDSQRGESTIKAMTETLARKGVVATAETLTRGEGRSTPDEILRAASEFNADLIVLGCYGQSRLRETIFGGATTRMLRDMTTPILMAH